MLTGKLPFDGTSEERIQKTKDVDTPAPPVSSLKYFDEGSIGRDLSAICEKCLQKDPKKRFRNMSQLVDRLDQITSHPRQGPKWLTAVSVGIACVGLLIAGVFHQQQPRLRIESITEVSTRKEKLDALKELVEQQPPNEFVAIEAIATDALLKLTNPSFESDPAVRSEAVYVFYHWYRDIQPSDPSKVRNVLEESLSDTSRKVKQMRPLRSLS